MTVKNEVRGKYLVSLRQVPDTEAIYEITYTPRDVQPASRSGRATKRVMAFVATAQVRDDEVVVDWRKRPSDPEATQSDFNQDVGKRVRLLHAWIERLMPLVSRIGTWAKELDWSVRQVDKPMNDSEIGDYRAPGLVLQQDTVRVGLEPIGRSAPGTEGVVDLYLLPAYDDIASFYFYDNHWNLHYLAAIPAAVDTVRDVESKPLSKAVLEQVLDELMKNAVRN
jgi:hypothetical protein